MDHPFDNVMYVEDDILEGDPSCLDFGNVQDVINERNQGLSALLNHGGVASLLGREIRFQKQLVTVQPQGQAPAVLAALRAADA